jgi:putative endonuclease
LGFYVYILRSVSGRSYVGYIQNLIVRLDEHTIGKSKATKGKGPWQLIHHEEFRTRSEASLQERFYKTVTGRIELKKKGIL